MKQKRTKSKITIINTILCVLFACVVGVCFAFSGFKIDAGSNPKSTAAYMARQDYSVINDSLINPIPFGVGAKNYEVAIKYSYAYDFDIRVKYSLSWSGEKSTDNVILNFADRNNYVYDDNFVYYTQTVPAGNGTLKIFTGVDFVDPQDENYFGQSLTINIDEVKIVKAATSYTTSHSLYQPSSLASKAWLKYKAKNIALGETGSTQADAYVLMYNYRYDTEHGVSYSKLNSAYKKTIDSTGAVTEYLKLGGNRYYAGIGAYIVTGSKPVQISGYAVGSWQGTEFLADNSIRFNYSSGWTNVSDNKSSYDSSTYVGEGSLRENKFNFVIPANSCVYVNMVDSMEITTILINASATEGQKTIVRVQLNDVSFAGANLTEGLITTESNLATANYTAPEVSVDNTGLYSSNLFNITERGNSTQTFYSHINVTNNTANKKSVSATYSLRYYLSNGSTSAQSELDGEGGLWRRDVFVVANSSYFELTNGNLASTYLAPYTSAELVTSFTINTSFYNYITSTHEGNYDVWVEIVPTVTSTTSTSMATKIDLLTSVNDNNIEFSLKNNSSEKVTVSDISVTAYNLNISYTRVSTKPLDWESDFWRYYYLDGQAYIPYSNNTFNSSNCYLKTSTYSILTGLTLPSAQNVTMQPNEIVYLGSTTATGSLTTLRFDMAGNISSGGATVANNIDIVNEKGNAQPHEAYIVNNSTKNYFVRFSGTYSGSNSSIVKIGSYNYYIGVVRANSILSLTVSSDVTLEVKEAGEVYSESAVWADAVSEFNKYFK